MCICTVDYSCIRVFLSLCIPTIINKWENCKMVDDKEHDNRNYAAADVVGGHGDDSDYDDEAGQVHSNDGLYCHSGSSMQQGWLPTGKAGQLTAPTWTCKWNCICINYQTSVFKGYMGV